MSLHAYQFGQLDEPAAIAVPEDIVIPDLSLMSDEELIAFAQSVYNKYLTDESRQRLIESLKANCLNRIRRLLLTCTEPDQIALFDAAILQVKALMKVYSFTIVGVPMEGDFNAPRHLWQNDELRQGIIDFFAQDENTHNFQDSLRIVDFIYLYCERITRG